jgi:hypothetical protein
MRSIFHQKIFYVSYPYTWIRMVKEKPLIVDGLPNEVKKIAAIRGRSLSSIIEEYLECLVFERWVEALSKELGLGDLEPTTESEIPRSRPTGLDAAAAVRELRGLEDIGGR